VENIFLKYMLKRSSDVSENKNKIHGPVITLSRQYGCYASKIAQLLADKLSARELPKGVSHHWSLISNEILDNAAQKLQVEPEKIAPLFGADEKNFLTDLVSSFSAKKYTSDSKIKKTITSVVKSYAEHGHVIIVGRAGCIIAKHIAKSLHIRLEAPYEWRVNRIMQRFDISKAEAIKQVEEFEKKRKTFMSFYNNENNDNCELFDAVFNRATLTENEIVESILKLVDLKNIV